MKLKPLDDFFRNAREKDGRGRYCKACQNEFHRDWRLRNPEKEREITRRAREKNRENYNKWSRESYQRHREKRILNAKAWRDANPDKARASEKRWAKSHRDAKRAQDILNKAVRKGKIQKSLNCQMCGLRREGLQGHHPDYEELLDVLWLCPECHTLTKNFRKGLLAERDDLTIEILEK
jgi:rubredoxin